MMTVNFKNWKFDASEAFRTLHLHFLKSSEGIIHTKSRNLEKNLTTHLASDDINTSLAVVSRMGSTQLGD